MSEFSSAKALWKPGNPFPVMQEKEAFEKGVLLTGKVIASALDRGLIIFQVCFGAEQERGL